MHQDVDDRIRLLAYELWLAADRPDGSSQRFWNEAEQLIASMDKHKPAGAASDALDAMDQAIESDRKR